MLEHFALREVRYIWFHSSCQHTRVYSPVSLIRIVSGQKEKHTPLTSVQCVFHKETGSQLLFLLEWPVIYKTGMLHRRDLELLLLCCKFLLILLWRA